MALPVNCLQWVKLSVFVVFIVCIVFSTSDNFCETDKLKAPKLRPASSSDATTSLPFTTFRAATTYDPVEEVKQAFEPVEPHVDGNATILEHLAYYGDDKPLIYFLTPTYKRTTQMVDMIRLSQTLTHDMHIYWIVIEDAKECTHRIRRILERSGLLFAHLAVKSPLAEQNPQGHRGVKQRNAALRLVQEYLDPVSPGYLYLGDDDNGYDVRMFAEMR